MIMESKSSVFTPYLFVTILIIILCILIYSKEMYILGILGSFLYPLFLSIDSIFTKYTLENKNLKIKQILNKEVIPVDKIKNIEIIKTNSFSRILVGMPKEHLKVHYNKYDDILLYPKNKAFQEILINQYGTYKTNEKISAK